jgi:PhnB protein
MSESTSQPGALIPYLIVDGAAVAIDFYVQVFGAVEIYRLVGRDGRVGHAELTIGGAQLSLADEYPEIGHVGPIKRGGTSCSLSLCVDDVDAMVERAVRAGAKLERPIIDEFYGERVGWIHDPFGHRWSLRKTIETLTPEMVKKRFDALAEQ